VNNKPSREIAIYIRIRKSEVYKKILWWNLYRNTLTEEWCSCGRVEDVLSGGPYYILDDAKRMGIQDEIDRAKNVIDTLIAEYESLKTP